MDETVARTVPGRAVAVRSRTREDASLSLLRADNLPAISAVLGSRFTRERRVVAVDDFLLGLDEDLAELRDAGFDLPQSPQEYLAEWVNERRWLVRRPSLDGGETVELSVGAATALAYLEQSATPRSALTSSRLSSITEQVGRLARDTHPDQSRRIAAMVAERDALTERIEHAERVGLEPLDDHTARERLQEILSLVVDLPRDFARVSADVDRLNRELRERIIRSQGSSSEVLEDTFSGVEAVDNSEAGRTFRAFYAILLDPSRSEAFDEAVDEVLGRAFARDLTHGQRLQLQELLADLQRESAQVRDTMTALSRSLRQFVHSRAWADQQRLDQTITQAQGILLDLTSRHGPRHPSGVTLNLTAVPVDSIAARRPYSPRTMRSAAALASASTGPVDMAALRQRVRESEIDFEELGELVARTLAVRPGASVADVLSLHGASQGLASVVGLLLLAQTHGEATDQTETVRWTSAGGAARAAQVVRQVFTSAPSAIPHHPLEDDEENR